MEKGWVKSHRQILDNIFLMHDNNAFMVFSKLLLMVNRKTGQLATGRKSLGEQVNLNSRTLYDVLLRLQDQQMVNIESNNRYSVITICNWSKYQDEPTAEPTSAQQPANNQPTTSQHYNKNKEGRIKNIAKSVSDDDKLLILLNAKTGRSFRILPKGYKDTLRTFKLEEISKAFDNMQADEWHSRRMSDLSSSYLLRVSTIDNMLNKSKSTQLDWMAKAKELSNGS